MKKNAFTLVELLAVIIILALLAVILITSINNLLDRTKESGHELLLSNIEYAAKNYVNENDHVLESLTQADPSYIIYLSDLISEGHLKSPVIDPLTNTEVSGNSIVEVKLLETGDISYIITLSYK